MRTQSSINSLFAHAVLVHVVFVCVANAVRAVREEGAVIEVALLAEHLEMRLVHLSHGSWTLDQDVKVDATCLSRIAVAGTLRDYSVHSPLSCVELEITFVMEIALR